MEEQENRNDLQNKGLVFSVILAAGQEDRETLDAYLDQVARVGGENALKNLAWWCAWWSAQALRSGYGDAWEDQLRAELGGIEMKLHALDQPDED